MVYTVKCRPRSGMLLLMSGSTLEPGIYLEGGGMELSNKKEMPVASLY